ncbi:hypothetical protein [Stenotrophomonas pavanii]|uniref:hypothetical protein n=1 Tax=Stenotrophomonas pavanii TaxID=487698 RepID=UPI0039C75908
MGQTFRIQTLERLHSGNRNGVIGEQSRPAMHVRGEDVALADTGMTAWQETGAAHAEEHGRAHVP